MVTNEYQLIYVWKQGDEANYIGYYFSTLEVFNIFVAVLDKDPLMHWDYQPPVITEE